MILYVEQSTAQETIRYIDTHPHVKWCLVRDVVNHTALAREIAKTIGRRKPSSHAAITVASVRYARALRKQSSREKELRTLLSGTAIELRNRMCVAILPQSVPPERILAVESKMRSLGGSVYAIRGTAHWTVIFEERLRPHLGIVEKSAVRISSNLALVMLKSSQDIETTPGVCAYLTGLFAQNGVNIKEFLSCWTDTLFVIEQRDVSRALEFLDFTGD